MPRSAIDTAYQELYHLLPKDMQADLESLWGKLDRSTLGVEARIPVRDFDLNAEDHTEWGTYGEDWEVGCVYRNSHTEEEVADHEELQSKIEECDEAIDTLESGIADLEDEIEELEDDDEVADRENLLSALRKSLEAAEKKLKDAQAVRDGWDDEEPVHDEIMWNTVWRPEDDDINEPLARELNFGILTKLDSGRTFIGLQGCGMDLTPKIVAYCALEWGSIDPSWVKYFTHDTSYTQYVMGRNMWNRVVTKLGLPDLVTEKHE